MITAKSNKKLIVIIASSVAVLLIAGLFVWVASMQQAESEPDPFIENSETTQNETPEVSNTPEEETSQVPVEEAETTIDPSTTSTVDIEPLAVTVSYVRGIPGFEFMVQRTQNGTQFVEFSSPELVGTKCTDDTGIFATIVADVTSDADRSTLEKTTTVNGETFGLTLPDSTCTSDVALFEQYQASFSDAFGLLKPLSSTED